jgi:hypothetical protein
MLNERLSGYVRYFERLVAQAPNRWDGFVLPKQDYSCIALQYQLAFPCYALATLILHPDSTPEERDRILQIMRSLIDRALQRRVWAYWGSYAELNVLSPDPISVGNLHYSAPLAMMLGIYTLVSHDDRYNNNDIVMVWSHEERFIYTYNALIDTLWRQISSSPNYAIEAMPQQITVPTMTHTMWALLLHDACYGSEFAAVNEQWLKFMKEKLLVSGLSLGRTVFAESFDTKKRKASWSSSAFNDAWALSLLAPLQPELTRNLAPRLFKAAKHTSSGEAFMPVGSRDQGQERGDQVLATAFSQILAQELSDSAMVDAFARYADRYFESSSDNEQGRFYKAGLSAPYTTALYLLAELGGFQALYQALDLRLQSHKIASSQVD